MQCRWILYKNPFQFCIWKKFYWRKRWLNWLWVWRRTNRKQSRVLYVLNLFNTSFIDRNLCIKQSFDCKHVSVTCILIEKSTIMILNLCEKMFFIGDIINECVYCVLCVYGCINIRHIINSIVCAVHTRIITFSHIWHFVYLKRIGIDFVSP